MTTPVFHVKRRGAIFNRRNAQRERLMVPAARVFTAAYRVEEAAIRAAGGVRGIKLSTWERAFRAIHQSVAESVWTETVDHILGTGKQVDPDVLRRIANNPGALRAVAVGARNAARAQVARNRAEWARIAEARGLNLEELIEALYSEEARLSRAQRDARREVLDVAAEQQQMAAEATERKLLKSWLSVQDSAVRPSHASADARYRQGADPGPIGLLRLFNVGGETALRPRSPSLSAGERINCRCQVLHVIPRQQ